jgi:hypothetical protein
MAAAAAEGMPPTVLLVCLPAPTQSSATM